MNRYAVGILLLIFSALLRVGATYPRLSHTADEPAHLACGMEWLDRGAYTYELQHPPLARVAAAIGPYFDGRRLSPSERKRLQRHADMQDGVKFASAGGFAEAGFELLLSGGGGYMRTLTLARLGVLPFFALLLAAIAMWAWPISRATALLAVLLASTTPMLLGHAGVATTDMAFTAFAIAGLAAFQFWLEGPSWTRGALLGATWALAFLSKFSAVLFLPVGAAAIWTTWFLLSPRLPQPRRVHLSQWRSRVGTLAVGAVIGILLIWTGYRFSTAPLGTPETRPHGQVDAVFGEAGPFHDLADYLIENVPMPAPEAAHGIFSVLGHSERGHPSFFLGEYGTTGWLLFFPVLLLVKTPIPILLLAAAGAYSAVRERAWRTLAPAAAAAAIVTAALPSGINIGSRHVLPAYALMCLTASYAITSLWRRAGWRAPVVGLLSWHLIAGAAAHPDYLGFFNAFGGRNPERIVVDSDLDWGQGLLALKEELRTRGIEEFWVTSYSRAGRVCRSLGMAGARELKRGERVTGWVAIVEFKYRDTFGEPPHDGYAWLEEYETVARIGQGLRLIYVPPPDPRQRGG